MRGSSKRPSGPANLLFSPVCPGEMGRAAEAALDRASIPRHADDNDDRCAEARAMPPGDALIDDWDTHRHRWEEAGGVFIHHRDAVSSIRALREQGFI